ncbi:MAG: substrate-binding domain-containing protein [Chloroflexota bacterium]
MVNVPRSPSSPRPRHTFGFLAGNLHTGVALKLWAGMIVAARKHDVNLFCFPGGRVYPVGEFDPDRSSIYRLVGVDGFDGLISSGATAPGGLSPEQTASFLDSYRPLPIVSLTRLPGQIPHVTIDSYQGMREIVLHLLQAHGLQSLAFVRGPENHDYAQKRYQAYLDTLHEQGLPVDFRLVTPPLPWEAGEQSIHILLEERRLRPGVDLQAVVTASDLAALGALSALESRGIRVPDDLVLTGFNDSDEGRLTTPPLTSVSMPFYEQGQQAIELLVNGLAGQPIPQQTTLPTRLAVRQSCGCPDQSVLLADLPAGSSGGLEPSSFPETCRNQVVAEAARLLGASGAYLASVTRLVDSFFSSLEDGDGAVFLSMQEYVLRSSMIGEGDVAAWQDVLSVLRRCTFPLLPVVQRLFAENLFGQARIVIGRVAGRAQALEQLQAERRATMLRDLGQELITTFDIFRLADVLAERLPEIGITSCFLALYEKPSLDDCTLILAYTEQGRTHLEAGGRHHPAHEIVPADLLPQHRQFCYVAEPLYFQHDQIGFIVFEVGPLDGAIYELLRTQVSNALTGALLLREAQQARQAAEKADQIKTRLLANVSHELRTPLNIILGYSQDALGTTNPYGIVPPQALLDDLEHIRSSAEHQLRLINDLLDLSRAEIDELDLYLELLDPHPLLQDAFQCIVESISQAGVAWRLELPERLPLIQADPVRLRQILLNLLSNANKFTEKGEIVLGARVEPPHLLVWVRDTGVGIPPDMKERIFEPFITAEHAGRRSQGVGLGLSITRRLVALHNGSMKLESQVGCGSTFYVYLPLPNLTDKTLPADAQVQPVLLLISMADEPATEIRELSQRQELAIVRVQAGDDLAALLSGIQPATLAWDLTRAGAGDWLLARRLFNHPRLSQTPLILYGQGEAARPESGRLSVGLTGVLLKPAGASTLMGTLNALCPQEIVGPILIVDDDPVACESLQALIAQGLPGFPILIAHDGAAALAFVEDRPPSVVVLDLVMPEMDGFDVLEQLRSDARTQSVPVIILTSKVLSLADIQRIERHTRVVMQSKGVLANEEVIAMLHRSLFDAETLPPETSALVKRTMAYLHQNYARSLSRWEIAQEIGVSENYLSQVFNRELGLPLWDYLNRFRISQAKELFRRTHGSVKYVANQVGFKDQKYFSRVFHKLTGLSPNAFKDQI